VHIGAFTEYASHPNSIPSNLFSCLDLLPGNSLQERDSPPLPASRPATSKNPLKRDCGRHISEWNFAAFFSHLDQVSRILFVPCPALIQEKVKWSEARKHALARDGYRCRNPSCRSGRPLTVHHIHPKGIGGSHNLSNLVTLCESCHQDLCATCSRPSHLRVPLGEAAMRYPDIARHTQDAQVA